MITPTGRHLPDHHEIYAGHAGIYEQLISREDHRNAILPALESILPLSGKDVIELGAGTGRLTRLLVPVVRSIRAFDSSPHMLTLAEEKLRGLSARSWGLAVSDHRRLAAEDSSADMVIAGWTLCYLVVWNGDSWREEIRRALAEMQRVLRPGGTMIILETLGTGTEVPHPPENLAAYYAYLEEAGFRNRHIRTDYRFPSMEEARSLCTFFFGEAMAERLIADGPTALLHECTGIWWLKRDPPWTREPR